MCLTIQTLGLTAPEYIMKYSSQMPAPKLRITRNAEATKRELVQVDWVATQIPRVGLPPVTGFF